MRSEHGTPLPTELWGNLLQDACLKLVEDSRFEVTFSNTDGRKLFSTVLLKKPNFLMGADKHNVHMFNNPHARYLNEGLSTGV